MRIAPMVVALWVFALIILLFNSSIDSNLDISGFGNGTNSSDGVNEILKDPTTFWSGLLASAFTIGLLTVGAGLFAAALGTVMKSDMVFLGGMMAVMAGLIAAPMQIIKSWMVDQTQMMMCPNITLAQFDAGVVCMPSLFVTAILLGLTAFMYAMAIFEWWTSRPLTR